MNTNLKKPSFASTKKWIQSVLHPATIQQRFFISYCIVAVIILAIVAVFFYNYTSKLLLNQAKSSMEERVQMSSSHLDDEVQKMQTIALNVSYSNLIKTRFISYFSPTEQSMINHLEDSRILMDMFVAINGPTFAVQQINIYNMSGEMVGSGLMNKALSFNVDALPWYHKTLEQGGKMVLSTPYISPILAEEIRTEEYYLSLYMLYVTTYGQHLGFIEIIQDCDTLFKTLIQSRLDGSKTSDTYVFNEDGVLIFPYESKVGKAVFDLDNNPTFLYESYAKNATSEISSSTFEDPQEQVKKIVTYKRSDYNHWLIFVTESEATVLKPVKDFTRVLFTVIFVIFVVAIFLSYIISRTLTRPLKDLHHMIHSTELDNLDFPIHNNLKTSYTELEEVNLAFINLKSKLKLSMNQLIESKQQETKALMQALQSLINPHFYYNSLSSILVMAETQQTEAIISYCRNLSSIMRYISTDSVKTVPLATELDYVTRYLACMKVRYPSSLNYQLQLPTVMEEIEIPKLIIQPLVENAVKYGMNCEPPWMIEITGELTQDGWLLYIRDKGDGFSDVALTDFIQKTNEFEVNHQIPPMQIDGMGLLNVYSRWQLFMGQDAYFNISNHKNGGAIITIGKKSKKKEV